MPDTMLPETVGEVLPGLHRVRAPFGERALYQHILVGSRYAVLIDAGTAATPETVLAPYLGSIGVSPEVVRLLISTHADADHVGGNSAVRRLFPRSLLAAHRADVQWVAEPDRMIGERYAEFACHGQPWSEAQAARVREMLGEPTPVDLHLAGGESLDLDGPEQTWEVRHVPGHTPGHLALWNPAARAAIIGDAALGAGVPNLDGSPGMAPTYRYVRDYLSTLDQLEALGAEWLFTAHFPVLRGTAVGEFLRESRAWVHLAQTVLADVLTAAPGPLALAEIIPQAAPRLGPWPAPAWSALAYPLLGGLEYLSEQEGAVANQSASPVTWRGGLGS